MKIYSLSLGMLLMSSLAFGNLLNLNGVESKKIENISISTGGSIQDSDRVVPVSLIGAGLRSKKVLIANVNVYVAEIHGSEVAKFVRSADSALNSIDGMEAIAIQMHFVRTVDAEKVQVSFQEAFTANSVDMKAPHINQFLKAIGAGGDATSGKTLTLAALKNSDGTESVIYENAAGTAIKIIGPKGFSTQIMSIWLGAPADSGIKNLKNQIISGK
jgi:hypothetical protein